MTEELKGCTVVFEEDVKDGYAESLLAAIRQIRGVLKVEPVLSAPEDWFAQSRVRNELGQKLLEVIYPPKER